jgi:cytochrome d ubiquinol oxidase subunit I
MRMEVSDFGAIVFNIVAQEKFVHTVSAGYVTGAMFVASISAIYLLLGKHIEIARRSITVAVSFGLASALSVVVLGDASGYTATDTQRMKIASIEGMWETEPPPASFTLFGLPNQATHHTDYTLRIPWVLGLITTHSIDEKVPGISELVQRARRGRRLPAHRSRLYGFRLSSSARSGNDGPMSKTTAQSFTNDRRVVCSPERESVHIPAG